MSALRRPRGPVRLHSLSDLRLLLVDHAEEVDRMARAARLPLQRTSPDHGPDSREAATPARATASTTTTRSGGPSGCTDQ